MNKSSKLRSQIKNIIENDRVEIPRRKQIKMNILKATSNEVNVKVKDFRQLLLEDIKKSSERYLINPFTRDISHLQDKKSPHTISLPILPTDLDSLKRLKNFDYQNLNPPYKIRRDSYLDSAFLNIKRMNDGEISGFDKIFMGNPTGRQDIKELCTWFSAMLEKYQESEIDTIMLIYETCAKELTRQVAVQCAERGELLQVLFNYQPEVYKRKIEEMSKEIQRIKSGQAREIEGFKEKLKKSSKEITDKNSLISKIINAGVKEKNKILDELNKLKLRYNEFVRKYNEEEKIWKNKHINLLVKLRDSFSTKPNSSSLLPKLGVLIEPELDKLQIDPKSIISQEIMEYEASIARPDLFSELTIETQEEFDTNKILEIYEKELKEEEEKKKEPAQKKGNSDLENEEVLETENEIKVEDFLLTEEIDEKTALETAEKSMLTDRPDFSFITELIVNISKIKPILSLESLEAIQISFCQDEKLAVPETDEKKPENLSISKNPSLKKNKRKGQKNLKKNIKKEAELQQSIDQLKQQLQEKTEALNDLISKSSSFLSSDKFKLSLGKALIKNLSSTPAISPGPQLIIPKLLSEQVSPRGSSVKLNEILKEVETDAIDQNLIPSGCDVYSWKTGYFTGFEKGKKEGFREGEMIGAEENNFENMLEEKDEKEEKDDETSPKDLLKTPSRSLRTELFRKKVKEITKIIQFQFNKPGIQKKQHPVYTLITKFMLRSHESVIANCTLSRKIINKMISSTFMNCLNKIRNGDAIESLVEQVYDDFYQKYGLKTVCEKRFLEFVSSLFSYTGFRRVSVFIKFLGCGAKAQIKSYSKLSFAYYLSALSMMINLKVGIMVAFDEIADKQMFPALRGIECVKEKLEWIVDKTKLNETISLIQDSVEPDTKGVNPSGLVELEQVLEVIIEIYEEYQKKIENGLIALFTAFGFDNQVTGYEFLVLLRHISPDRLDLSEDEGKTDQMKKLNLTSFIKEFEAKDSYSLIEISTKCLNHNLLKIDDVQKFVQEGEKTEEIQDRVFSTKDHYEGLAKIIGNNGKKYKSLNCEGFMSWIQEVCSNIKQKSAYHSALAWKIIESELDRVKTELII